MRRFLKIIAGIVSFLLLALISLPFLVPADLLKNKAIGQIEEMTGRKVVMGEVKLTVFPNIALSAHDVSIGNPAWVKGNSPMVKVKTLRIGVELMPLLHKDIHVTDLALDGPLIHLIKNGNEANWQFGHSANSSQGKQKAAPKEEGGSKSADAPLRLDSLSVKNGTFVYEDMASGGKQTLSDVDVKLIGKDLPHTLSVKGNAVVNGTKAEINLSLGTPMGLTSGTPSNVEFDGGYGDFFAKWKGTLALKGSVPSLTGTVEIPALDTTAAGGKSAAQPATKAGAPAGSGERWSTAPINMDGLKAANANITLTIGKLVLKQMTIPNVKTHVTLENGALQAAVDELPMFGGSVKMDVSAQAGGAAVIKAAAKNIQTEELLNTLAKSKVLTGVLNGGVNLTVHGRSQKEMVSSLNGTGDFALKDGVYRGGNLLNMTKNIATSFQAGQSKGETTDFSSLAGTFNAKNGVIFNDDLKMTGSLLNLTGKGQIDLPEWLVHYLLTPVMVTNRGSATQAASGISIPVQVEGSLDSPSYHPDLRGALEEGLKNPEKLKENIQDLKKNLNKDALKKTLNKDTLKGLLGR